MDRVVKGQPSKVVATLLDIDEQPAVPDAPPTYTVTYSDGTAGPTGTASAGSTVGVYHAVVTIPYYEDLRIQWAYTVGGNPYLHHTMATVVSNRLFTLDDLRKYDSSLVNKNPDLLRRARDYVEAVFDRETGRSFVVAFARESFPDFYGGELWLSNAEPIEVLSYSIWSLPYATTYQRGESLRSIVVPRHHVGNTEISYTYGRTSVPIDIRRAALKLARDTVMGNNSRIDDRAYALTIADMGTVTLATPGQRGSRTGLPEVDVVLDAWDIRVEGVA